MGSSQSAPVQQVVNTIKQFGYHPTTVFKFFVVIGIIAGVTICALAIWRHKKALDVSAPLRAAKVLRKATQQDAHIEYTRTRSPQLTTPATMPPPTTTFSHVNENPGTVGLLSTGYPYHLHNNALVPPISTSLFQFSVAAMVWSANPIRSITQLHNENMATSYADGSTLTSQPILPAAASSTLRHPPTCLPCLDFRRRAIIRGVLWIYQYVRVRTSPRFASVSEPLAASWVRPRSVT